MLGRGAWLWLVVFAALACVGDPAGLANGGCPEGSSPCGDVCVDLQLDRSHCGTCDAACPAEQVCSLGACGLECFGGTERCGDACVDPMVDPDHCGGCDKSCGTGTCQAGTCPCANGLHDGDETDVDCGGSTCVPCTEGKVCGGATDCDADLRCINGICGVPLPPLDDALVGFWRFEGNAEDGSGNGNNGMVVNATAVPGQVGGAYNFTDGACITVPDSASLDMVANSTLTMMAWVRFTGGCTDDRGIILNKEDTYELGVRCLDSIVQEAIQIDGLGWNWNGTGVAPLDIWQHVAITWDGTTVRHYLNAAEVFSRAQAGALPDRATGFGIGCRDVEANGGTSLIRSFFSGDIDEVAVYARALTAIEIQSYHEQSK